VELQQRTTPCEKGVSSEKGGSGVHFTFYGGQRKSASLRIWTSRSQRAGVKQEEVFKKRVNPDKGGRPSQSC
jgi:hypothetical protein